MEGAEGEPAEPPESEDDSEEGEGPGMSLSALEEKLKPEVLANFEEIEALYKKLQQGAVAPAGDDDGRRGHERPVREKLREAREELVGRVEQVRLHNNRIEELVVQLKQLNQRLNQLEGQLLRMGEQSKLSRDEFLKEYRGHELDPNWMERVAHLPGRAGRRSRPSTSIEVLDVRAKIGRWRRMPACRSPSSAAST